jgi:hypothetical protein
MHRSHLLNHIRFRYRSFRRKIRAWSICEEKAAAGSSLTKLDHFSLIKKINLS